jgi:hypothetical protein
MSSRRARTGVVGICCEKKLLRVGKAVSIQIRTAGQGADGELPLPHVTQQVGVRIKIGQTARAEGAIPQQQQGFTDQTRAFHVAREMRRKLCEGMHGNFAQVGQLHAKVPRVKPPEPEMFPGLGFDITPPAGDTRPAFP